MRVSKIHTKGLAICGSILLTFTSSPAKADLFELLFGDAQKSVLNGTDASRAHDDNIRLLSVNLRDQPLIDIVSAYEIEDDICIEISPVFEALNFPVFIKNGQLQGWLHESSATIDLDLLSRQGFVSGRAVSFAAKDIQKTDLSLIHI